MIIKIFNKEGKQESSYSFKDKQIILGRNPKLQNSVLIDSQSVSRSHLKISLKNHKIKIQDLNSSNGTFVNGQQIQKNSKIQITKNDKITLANFDGYVTVKIRQQDNKKQTQSSEQSNSREQRERSRDKNKKRGGQNQIAESTLKMLRSMTADKKSKSEKIKFLKLMGYHNAQQDWQQIEQMIKSKKSYFLSNSNKKASQQLQKQFSQSRAGHQKRGLGK